jgi:hypothetical protein
MKIISAFGALILCSCSTLPWQAQPRANDATCTASCDVHFEQCPQIFAGFPGRADSECPAEHNSCLKSCATGATGAPAVVHMVAPVDNAGHVPPAANKRARLSELKSLHDEGLITDDVYSDRQKAILAEP